MSHLKTFAVAAIALGALTWSAAPAAPAATESEQLLSVLQSDAAHAQKLAACQRLAVIGDKSAALVLARLLADERLSHPARIALEQIPDAADEALRTAAGQLKGRILVGVVNSLGVRRDAQAVAVLAPLLTNSDAEVAAAAATAFGKIATPESAAALRKALAAVDGPVREAVGDACLRCAEAMLRQNQGDAAREVCDAVRASKASDRVRAAAVRGAILSRPGGDNALFTETLRSPSPVLFAMALTLGRELRDPAITKAILEQLAALPIERRAAALVLLGDRGDPAARPAVMEAARQPDPLVRAAALAALGKLGDAAAIPLLLDARAQADAAIAAAARDSLAVVSGEGVDAALAAQLDAGKGVTHRVAIEAAGRRRMTSAVPTLLKLADAPDAAVRQAALAALGNTVSPQQLPVLVERLLKPASAAEQAATFDAVRVACTRMTDKEPPAQLLIAALRRAAPGARQTLFEALAFVGGPAALKALAEAALSNDAELQDLATRALGDWATPDAANTLREVAQKAKEAKFRVRALRGYLRIARQMDISDGDRWSMCREALKIAERNEERALALEIFGRSKQASTLDVVAPYMQDPGLKAAAAAAVVSIAERLTPEQIGRAVAPLKQVAQAANDEALRRRANDVLQRAAAGQAPEVRR